MKVYYLSLKPETPAKGYWDYHILERIFEGFDYETRTDLTFADGLESAIVVLSGRHHSDCIDLVNREIQKIPRLILFLMGDEENSFPVDQINHSHCIIWVQNPRPGKHDAYRKLGCGYPPHIDVDPALPVKDMDVFFSGQITHERRESMLLNMPAGKNISVLPTKGFTQGLAPADYTREMKRAKIAPCPSGPQTPDTFRLYEALELGAVPIADTQTPHGSWEGFWQWLFDGEVPFPTIEEWNEGRELLPTLLEHYPVVNNRVQAWWYHQKQKVKEQFHDDVESLGEKVRDEVTILVPVSPISAHPDTSILEETIASIRFHFPNSPIMIMFDGVRSEHEYLRGSYEEHIRRVLWLCRTWKNVSPHIFNEHRHQVGMTREVLKEVKSEMILFVEQDTPLVIDEPIDWTLLKTHIKEQRANVIRLHFEGQVPHAHDHLMLPPVKDGLLATIQWSQRPHLASAEFYRQMLEDHFSHDAKCFIEDKIHGAVQDDYGVYGLEGWKKWKIHIYYPNEKNIKRSYHTDGRAGAPKLDETQIW